MELQRQKIYQFIRHLRTVLPVVWNLSEWAEATTNFKVAGMKYGKLSCGTAGCACGHATTIFWKQGFVLDCGGGAVRLIDPVTGQMLESEATGAAASFFGMSRRDAEKLFYPSQYCVDSADIVADRLAYLLHNGSLDNYECPLCESAECPVAQRD